MRSKVVACYFNDVGKKKRPNVQESAAGTIHQQPFYYSEIYIISTGGILNGRVIAVNCLNAMITKVYVSFRERKSEKQNKVENGIREKLRALHFAGFIFS